MQPTKFDQKSFETLASAMEEAQHNDQPFMGQGPNDTPVIVGDVNNTDSEKDYTVEFLYPKGYAVIGDQEETEDGILVTRQFTGISITPRKARRMRHAVATMLMYLSKVNEKTGVQEVMTFAELAEVYSVLSDDVLDAMENIVQVSLGISDIDMEYITDVSLINVAGELVTANSGFFQ